MSQFTANDFADATKKKKKPGAGAMVGPPTIVPPVMQPWDQQVVAKPAVQRNPYQDNLLDRRAGQGVNPQSLMTKGPLRLDSERAGINPESLMEKGPNRLDGAPVSGSLMKLLSESGESPSAAALAQVLKQRTMAKAAPQQPAAPAGPDLNGPTRYAQDRLNAPVDPDVQAGMASIEQRRLREGLQRRFSQMAGGASPEKIARADEMAGIRYERENIDRANRPIQKVQSENEIAGARYNIGQSLISNADTIHKAAMDQIAANPDMQRTDPALYAKLMDDVQRSERMRATAQTKLKPYTVGDVDAAQGLMGDQGTGPIAAIQQNQKKLALKQEFDRRVGEASTLPLAYDTAAGKASQLGMRDKGRQLQEAAANTALAETNLAGAEATMRSDPKVMAERLKAEQLRAAQEARMAGAQGRAGARDAAYGGAGLGSPEAIAEFNNKAERAINSNDPEAFSLAIVPQLEQIAELDPQEADRIARSLLLVSQQSRPGIGSAIGDAIGQAWRGPGGIDMGKTSFIKRAQIDETLRKFLINP